MVLRRLAYNGEARLAEHFNAYLADPDEHRAILRHLLHLGGRVDYRPAGITVTLDRPDSPRVAHALGLLTDEARRRAARPLVHRGPTPMGPRRDLRRGPVPGPHRQRPPRHGQPAQPRDHHLAPDPDREHRRSPPTPCPTIGPAPTDDHDLLMDFAGALRLDTD